MRSFTLGLALLLLAAGLVHADVTVLGASKDNTMYETVGSNGAGNHLFGGVNSSSSRRRALLSFDVAGAIPAGSTINSVTLRLYMSRTQAGSHPMGLHRLLTDWGEGNSQASGSEGSGAPASSGDATWTHTFFPAQFWTNAGGDFTGIASATTSVGGVGFYSWSSGTLAMDVQNWLDSPSSNYGWILIGDEGFPTRTAKRFESRSHPTTSRRPELTIDYTPPVVNGACCAANDSCSFGTTADCSGSGGTFQGLTSSCSPNPCFDPTGACCYSDGSCSELSTASCSLTSGTHQGNGTTCLPGTCPEPVGACCADSGLCSTETENDCDMQGGTYGGNGTSCAAQECAVILEPFVDALPIPEVMQPTSGTVGGVASYEIAVTQFQQQLHRDLNPTTLWGYDGKFPGPTVEAGAYDPLTVTWINDLRDSQGTLRTDHLLPVDLCPHGPNFLGASARSVVHLHGAHVRAEFDGYPEDTILPGQQQVYVYSNDQLPATLWYHDHALGITRLNVYLGMAGFYLIRDPFELSLALPSGEYEIPLVIQDRKFNPDGSFFYPADWVDHFFGDTILVNGKVWPFLDVKQGKYRFRLLNGSGSRTLTLSLSYPGLSFQQIGTDGGLLDAPVTVNEITLASAERADVVVDFSGIPAGTEILLTNGAPAPFPSASTDGVIPNVMKFVVTSDAGDTTPLPATLRPMEQLQVSSSVQTRDFELFLTSDPCTGTAWSINGLKWDDITEYPFLDTTEIWRFINRSEMMHPMHMHLVMFQVLDRQPFSLMNGEPVATGAPVPPSPEEAGWKDTVRANPGEITRVIARFEDYKGKFAYHCHIVEHEDNEMMRQFETIDCGDGLLDPTEICDDGNAYPGDGCTEFCETEESMELAGMAQGGTVQINVSGVTLYGLAFSGQTAEQVAASLANQINSNATLGFLGITARVEGGVIYTNGNLSITAISDAGLVSVLNLGVGRTRLFWTRVEDSSSTDVVRGDLTTLRMLGDFSASTQSCATNNETAVWAEALDEPSPMAGYWYLARATNAGGTYDSGTASQAASRDAGIAASGNACP